jgi:hypothetical protein
VCVLHDTQCGMAWRFTVQGLCAVGRGQRRHVGGAGRRSCGASCVLEACLRGHLAAPAASLPCPCPALPHRRQRKPLVWAPWWAVWSPGLLWGPAGCWFAAARCAWRVDLGWGVRVAQRCLGGAVLGLSQGPLTEWVARAGFGEGFLVDRPRPSSTHTHTAGRCVVCTPVGRVCGACDAEGTCP